jgi:glycosyltransferase involved in cell wall biosynthesis
MPDSQIRQRVLPQRILMTADAVGGIWTYALDLAEQFSRLGMATMVATMGPAPTDAQRSQAAAVRSLELVESSFPLEWMPNVSETALAEAGIWLKGLESYFQPDVIHLNGYAHATCRWNALAVVVAHSCVSSWWLGVHAELPPAEWKGYCDRVLAGLEAADAVVAPSRCMLESVRTIYSPRLKRSEVIHNFTNLKIPSAEKQPVILAAGRLWDRAKNLTLLDRLAPATKWPIEVAGEADGPDGSVFRPEHVQLLGRVSRQEMAQRLGEAAMFVHPAKYEPFGLSVLEAARAACVLVLADIPSLRELWDGCALFVPPDDVDCWKSCIDLATRSARLRQEYSIRALLRSHEFGANSTAQSYLELYASLADVNEGRGLRRRSSVAQ